MFAKGLEDPLEELNRENDVAEKLVERLAEDGLALGTERSVPPGEIAEGLRLLSQYRDVHARRFDGNLEPEARVVAMPSCFEHLDTIARESTDSAARFERARATVDAYARGEPGARSRLAAELGDLTQKEYDALRYEGDYPLSCLRATLPDAAADRVRAGFERTDPELADLEHHIDRYLGRGPAEPGRRFPIRCLAAGCDASAQAETYPAANGYLGIRAPEGWRATSRPPRAAKDGVVAVDIDFSCPKHVASAAAAPVERPITPSARARPSTAAEPPASCPCCDPLPESSA